MYLIAVIKILSEYNVAKITNNMVRIVSIYVTFLYFIYMQFIFPPKIYGNSILVKSEILGAIVTIVFVISVMGKWNYENPKILVVSDGIPIKEYSIVCLMIILIVGWGWLHSDGSLLDNILKYRYTPINFSPSNLLVSVEAGAAEETVFRYGILTILLYKFRNSILTSRGKIIFVLLIDACLFGFGHLLNVVSGESMIACLFQAFDATISGFVFASIYLYTEQFLFPVIFHFLYDLMGAGFSLITFIDVIDLPFSSVTGYSGIRYIIWILVIVFMLTGGRYRKIKENFEKM